MGVEHAWALDHPTSFLLLPRFKSLAISEFERLLVRFKHSPCVSAFETKSKRLELLRQKCIEDTNRENGRASTCKRFQVVL